MTHTPQLTYGPLPSCHTGVHAWSQHRRARRGSHAIVHFAFLLSRFMARIPRHTLFASNQKSLMPISSLCIEQGSNPTLKRGCAKARSPLATRYAHSGGFSLCRRFKASSISTAWLSGRARIHSTSQRGSFTPTGIFFSSSGEGLRPAPLGFEFMQVSPEQHRS